MRTIGILTVALAATTFFSSCKKNEFKGTTDVMYKFEMDKSSKSYKTAQTGELKFESGYMQVSEIEFDGKKENGEVIQTELEQSTTIDLKTGTASPSLEYMTIEAGEYQYVEIGLQLYKTDNNPSIILEGNYTIAGASIIPVRFELTSDIEFHTRSKSMRITSDGTKIITIKINPHDWFAGVDASLLANSTLTNGTLVINESRNSNIYAKVILNINASADIQLN